MLKKFAILILALLQALPLSAATYTVYYSATTGGTYYAYPANQSLADWTTYRIQLVEASAPNLGRYSNSLGDTEGNVWHVFSGASQPSAWSASLGQYTLENYVAPDAISAGEIATDAITASELASNVGGDLTSIPWPAAWDSEVQSEADDALVARGLDHLFNVAIAGTDVNDNSFAAKLVSKSATADFDTFVWSTDSLEAVRDSSDAAAVWSYSAASRTLSDGAITTSTFGTGAIDAAAIATDAFGASELAAGAANEIADTNWDELQSGHLIAGSFGKYVDSSISGVSTGGVTAAEIAIAILEQTISGHTTAGTVGGQIGTDIDAILGHTGTTGVQIPAGEIVAGTFGSGAIDAAALAADAGTEIATANWALGTRTLTAGTNIVLAKGTGVTGFNDLSAAQVNAEADTALADYDAPTNAEMVARTLASASYGTAATQATILADTNELQTDWSNGGRLDLILDSAAAGGGAPTVEEIRAEIDSNSTMLAQIEGQTDDIGAAGIGLTAIPWNSLWDAEAQSEAADALAAYDSPTNAEMVARTLPSAEYATAANLQLVDDFVDGVESGLTTLTSSVSSIAAIVGDLIAGETQPRFNSKPDPGFTVKISRRADGTHEAQPPIRITAGSVNNVFAFVDMSPVFGNDNFVQTVGSPTIAGGSITVDDEGPRDSYAVVELGGTATAGEEQKVTVPVTMRSGTTVNAVFTIKVFAQ